MKRNVIRDWPPMQGVFQTSTSSSPKNGSACQEWIGSAGLFANSRPFPPEPPRVPLFLVIDVSFPSSQCFGCLSERRVRICNRLRAAQPDASTSAEKVKEALTQPPSEPHFPPQHRNDFTPASYTLSCAIQSLEDHRISIAFTLHGGVSAPAGSQGRCLIDRRQNGTSAAA